MFKSRSGIPLRRYDTPRGREGDVHGAQPPSQRKDQGAGPADPGHGARSRPSALGLHCRRKTAAGKKKKKETKRRTFYHVGAGLGSDGLAAVESKKWIRVQLKDLSSSEFRTFCQTIKRCTHLVINVEGAIREHVIACLGIMAKDILIKGVQVDFLGADMSPGSWFKVAMPGRLEPVSFELTSPPSSPGPAAEAGDAVDGSSDKSAMSPP